MHYLLVYTRGKGRWVDGRGQQSLGKLAKGQFFHNFAQLHRLWQPKMLMCSRPQLGTLLCNKIWIFLTIGSTIRIPICPPWTPYAPTPPKILFFSQMEAPSFLKQKIYCGAIAFGSGVYMVIIFRLALSVQILFAAPHVTLLVSSRYHGGSKIAASFV